MLELTAFSTEFNVVELNAALESVSCGFGRPVLSNMMLSTPARSSISNAISTLKVSLWRAFLGS